MSIQYTKEWTRIYGGFRPVLYLSGTVVASALVAVLTLFFTHDLILTAILAGATLIVAAIIDLLVWQFSKRTAINLGEAQIRTPEKTYHFHEIVQAVHTTGNIVLTFEDGAQLLLPAIWLPKSHLRIIQNMLLIADGLENPKYDEARHYLHSLIV